MVRSEKNPLILYKNGKRQTYRILTGMVSGDTQEYATQCHTKNINTATKYPCALCYDEQHELTDPNRRSFWYPRSNNHILELAGDPMPDVTVPISSNEKCKRYADWKKKGYGYTPTFDVVQLRKKYISDPHYSITVDIYHGALNQFRQLFGAIKHHLKLNPDSTYAVFIRICDFCKMNNLEARFTEDNWKGRGDLLKDISLEMAPSGLVKSITHILALKLM